MSEKEDKNFQKILGLIQKNKPGYNSIFDREIILGDVEKLITQWIL